jgi:peptidoglycan/xylan/chitin deacetylase (PgdA/CDA1 family)
MWRGILAALISAVALAAAAHAEPQRTSILVYHRLGPVLADEMTVTTPVFQEQLALIESHGWTVVPLRTLLAAQGEATAAAALPQKSTAITIDDGHHSVYTELFPLLKKHRIPVTLFIYPSAISNASYAMTWAELAEMKASGLVDLQSHTFWHPNFNIERRRLSPEAYARFTHDQFIKSKAILEQKLGGRVDLLAWPFGIHDSELEQWARQDGYTAAFTIDRRPVTRGDNPMALPRYIVVDADRGARFEALLEGGR